MNRNIIAACAAIAVLSGGTGYLLAGGEDASRDRAPATTPETATTSDIVVMTPERIKTADIALVEVGPGAFGSEIVAQGSIEAPPNGVAVLTAGAEGRVTRITKQIGDAVSQGQVVARIESRDAADISGDLRAAQARAAQARAEYEREQRLFDAKVTAEADLQKARADYQAAVAAVDAAQGSAAAAGVTGRYVLVRSPISGSVTAASAKLGNYVSPETELFRIANPNLVQAQVSVPVADGRRIERGARAVIEAGGQEIPARVRSVTPSANPESRTLTVILTPTAGRSMLTPGDYIRARITAAKGGEAGLSVPAEAVQSVGGRDVVFVRTDKGFAPRSVQLGARTSAAAQILNGLKPGETIAGANAFLLKAELEKGSGEEE
ncbi:MAG: efflux RND transporter periplasmic adaptor subunit [Sphingomonadaceae bacterium]